jgi:Domain of unknown function (DUF4407)
MNIRLRLARLSGARPDVLLRAPGDITRHAAMGGVLLSTAMVAAASAFFALSSTLALPWSVCLLIALGWALVVFNLDRMLIVTMTGLRTTGLKLMSTVPRLLLAIIIGSVISTPLVLRIFQPEINAQLTIIHAQTVDAAKQQLDKTYADIQQLTAEQTRLQSVIAGRTSPAVTDDPNVKSATKAYNDAETVFEQRAQQAQCELNGTCGTGHSGDGTAYDQAKALADDAKQTRDAARTAMNNAMSSAASRLHTAAGSDAASARKQLPQVQQQLATEQQRQQTEQGNAQNSADKDNGLLVQLEALGQITDGHPMASLAHLMLFLLFLSIELLPVVTKLLAGFGAPTLYDRLVAREDDDVDGADILRARIEKDIEQVRADGRLTLARAQTDTQVMAGRVAMQALVDQQTAIALKAVAMWGDLAKLRADEQLDQWYRTHIAPLRNGQSPDVVSGTAFRPASLNELTIPMTPVRPPSATNGAAVRPATGQP